MGDRCYLNVTVRKDHYEKFKACEEFVNPSEEVETDHTIELTYYEANYGNGAMLDEAARAGCEFYGWHGSGSEYDAANFFSENQSVEYIYTGQDNYGMLVVGATPDAMRQHLERLISLDAARDALIKRLSDPLYDLVSEAQDESVQCCEPHAV